MKKHSVVLIRRVRKVVEATKECFNELKRTVKQGDFVVVKPNLTGGRLASSGATVHPQLLSVVLLVLKKMRPRRIIVAEDPGAFSNTLPIFKKLGIISVCREAGVELVHLNKDNYRAIKISNGMLSNSIEIANLIIECDKLISLTTLKTHHQVGITIAMKNMFSNVPNDLKRKFHRSDLGKALVDINLARKADYTIVDGLIGVEGLGPIWGTPVSMNLMLGGSDPVAVDTVGAKLMGFNPDGVLYLRYAAERGLGTNDIEQIEIDGPKIKNINRKFKTPLNEMEEKLAGKIDIVHRGECLGCMGIVATALVLSSERYQEELFPHFGNLKIYLGEIEKMTADGKRMIVIGDCAKYFRYQAAFVPGCPPSVTNAINAILDTQIDEEV